MKKTKLVQSAAEAAIAAAVDDVSVIRIKPEHGHNLISALPADTKHGDTFLLLGDPGVRGIDHCALIIVVQERPNGLTLLGPTAKKHIAKMGPEIDLLGFMVDGLMRRVDDLEDKIHAGTTDETVRVGDTTESAAQKQN